MRKHPDRSGAADWVVRRDAGFSATEKREFEQWLKADPSRGLEMERLDATWTSLDRPLSTGAADRVMGEIALRRRRRQWRRWTVAVGGLATVVALLVLPARNRSPAPVPPSPPAVVQALPLTRTLPDGSVVALKHGADLQVHFSDAVRLVVLNRGEALFQVTKNARRPFVVQAGGVKVRAVGTAFSVEWRSHQVEVLVAEGRVALDRALQPPSLVKAAQPSTLVILDAGNRALVDSTPRPSFVPEVFVVPKAEIRERLAWSRPELEFSGTLLPDAVALLNQYNRAKFVIADPALAALRVSGYIRADNIEGFASMLEGSFGIRAERTSETEILLRRTP